MKKKDVPSRKRNSDEDTGVAKRKKIEDSDSRIKKELKQKYPEMPILSSRCGLVSSVEGYMTVMKLHPRYPYLQVTPKTKALKKAVKQKVAS